MSSLELGYLTFGFFASNSITFLNLLDELIALSFNDLPIIVDRSAPLFLSLPGELFLISFELVGVHHSPL